MHNQVKSVQNSSKLGDFDVRDIREITFSLDKKFIYYGLYFVQKWPKTTQNIN